MFKEIVFPHKLSGTLSVLHWYHIQPEGYMKGKNVEIFFTFGEIPHRLIGSAKQLICGIRRVCLAEHAYGENANVLCLDVEKDFSMAVRDLCERGVPFQTSAYSMAPNLFTIYQWEVQC